jgi:pimeloyl-ACP methyl ester carboxylesterase
MQPSNVMFHELALTNPAAVFEMGDAMAAGIQADAAAVLDGSANDLPDVDREIMREPEVREMMLASMTEAVRQGGRAFAEEMLMFSRPWGIPFGEITVPVQIWHGTLDRNVPVSHAEYVAAQIPTATLKLLEGEGHMTLAMRHSVSFLADFLA